MTHTELLTQAVQQAEQLRDQAAAAAASLRDFTRRLELILSQDHKNIPVRDQSFAADFSLFCQTLRAQTDAQNDYWLKTRAMLRALPKTDLPEVLPAKGFTLRAKALSRATDELTTAYDYFNRFYKNYTLAKLPVWLLTSCCDDLTNLTGKILFLAREESKLAEKARGN